ncbi:hypothetical protein EJB05_31489, partial [Eragrostis curvula]
MAQFINQHSVAATPFSATRDVANLRFRILPMPSGIEPEKLFMDRLPMDEGMLPEIPVSQKLRVCRFVERFAIELGSCPLKAALLEKSKKSSWVQFDKEVRNSHPSPSSASSLL